MSLNHKNIGFKILLGVFLLITLMVGYFVYQSDYRKTEIITSYSNDSSYQLIIDQIGDPDFPYGATHCESVLKKGKKTISKQSFDLYDDGANATESNFQINWQDDCVLIAVSASEQNDETYCFYFDGLIDHWIEE